MEPMRTIKVIGYNESKRKGFNDLFNSLPVNCTTTENKRFENINISLTER